MLAHTTTRLLALSDADEVVVVVALLLARRERDGVAHLHAGRDAAVRGGLPAAVHGHGQLEEGRVDGLHLDAAGHLGGGGGGGV